VGQFRLAKSTKSGKQNVELFASGDEVMSTGRRGAFRVYSAPDGTKAEIHYTTFGSLRDAERQTEQWLKPVKKVIRKENEKDETGQVMGIRIVAMMRGGESGEKLFLIIRRDGLKCFFISSPSLTVAMQVEELIREKP
jgi:hypothetical protein